MVIAFDSEERFAHHDRFPLSREFQKKANTYESNKNKRKRTERR